MALAGLYHPTRQRYLQRHRLIYPSGAFSPLTDAQGCPMFLALFERANYVESL
jgi:hypothetical protein